MDQLEALGSCRGCGAKTSTAAISTWVHLAHTGSVWSTTSRPTRFVRMKADGFAPAAVVEASLGNFQEIVAVAAREALHRPLCGSNWLK
jgi:hypothetical protein